MTQIPFPGDPLALAIRARRPRSITTPPTLAPIVRGGGSRQEGRAAERGSGGLSRRRTRTTERWSRRGVATSSCSGGSGTSASVGPHTLQVHGGGRRRQHERGGGLVRRPVPARRPRAGPTARRARTGKPLQIRVSLARATTGARRAVRRLRRHLPGVRGRWLGSERRAVRDALPRAVAAVPRVVEAGRVGDRHDSPDGDRELPGHGRDDLGQRGPITLTGSRPPHHPPVADPAGEAVDVHPLEEELRVARPDAREVAEPRERDLAGRRGFGRHEVARDLVGARRRPRSRRRGGRRDPPSRGTARARHRRPSSLRARPARAPPRAPPPPRRARRATRRRPEGTPSAPAARRAGGRGRPRPTARPGAARRAGRPGRGRAPRRGRGDGLDHAGRLLEPGVRERPAVDDPDGVEPLLELGAVEERSGGDGLDGHRLVDERADDRGGIALVEKPVALGVDAARRRGSSTTAPPTVVSVRRTTRSPRAATTGAASRSWAWSSPTRTTRAGSGSSRGARRAGRRRDRLELGERDLEPVRARERAGRDERVAAADVAPLDARQVDGHALPGLGPSDRRVVHLHRADAHVAPGRLQPQVVALGDRARPQRPGDDRADPAQREDPVDVEPGREVGASLLGLAGDFAERGTELVEALPVTPLTATTGAPGRARAPPRRRARASRRRRRRPW